MERVRVERYGTEGDLVELARADPHPALAGDALGYTGYRERTFDPLRRRELLFAGVVVIFSRGPEFRLGDPDDAAPGTSYTSFVAGLDDRAVLTEPNGASDGLQLDLTPFGAYRLFRVPMWELARRAVPLDEVLGREGAELAESLDGAARWEQRFDLLDGWLARRLERVPRASPHLEWAWRRIVETDGRILVERLAGELGCSRRHLAAGFREQVGLPPKAVAQVLRFRRAAPPGSRRRPAPGADRGRLRLLRPGPSQPGLPALGRGDSDRAGGASQRFPFVQDGARPRRVASPACRPSFHLFATGTYGPRSPGSQTHSDSSPWKSTRPRTARSAMPSCGSGQAS